MTVVKNGCTISIGDGDKFALLPDEYWFRVQIDNTVKNEYNLTNNPSVSETQTFNETTIQNESIDRLKREHSENTDDENPAKRRKSIDVEDQNDISSSRSTTPDLLQNDNLDNEFLEVRLNSQSDKTSESKDDSKTESNKTDSTNLTHDLEPNDTKNDFSNMEFSKIDLPSTSTTETVCRVESDVRLDSVEESLKSKDNIEPVKNDICENIEKEAINEDVQNVSNEFDKDFEDTVPDPTNTVVSLFLIFFVCNLPSLIKNTSL